MCLSLILCMLCQRKDVLTAKATHHFVARQLQSLPQSLQSSETHRFEALQAYGQMEDGSSSVKMNERTVADEAQRQQQHLHTFWELPEADRYRQRHDWGEYADKHCIDSLSRVR